MTEPTYDIALELLFIESAILNDKDYNSASIESKIDRLFEATIEKSEIKTGSDQSYYTDFKTWKRKLSIPSKKQSLIIKEILSITKEIIKDSKRVQKGKNPRNSRKLDDSRFEILQKDLNASFEDIK